MTAKPGFPSSRLPFSAHFAGGVLVLGLTLWLSSGTLTPYGALISIPPVPSEPCHYLYNGDHWHFAATFAMLDGQPRDAWIGSVVLRRILYPLLSYPFMKWLGFEYGGFLTSVLLHLGAVAASVFYLRRRIGERGAAAALWLLATYPGIAYWSGMPYCYVVIVPFCLLLWILISELEGAATTGRTLALSLGMGVLFTGYDLLPIFLPAALMVLSLQKRWRMLPLTAAAAALPYATSLLVLRYAFKVPLLNSNTETYSLLIKSYLNPPSLEGWWGAVRSYPAHFLSNYLFSNFLFLPLLFIALVMLNRLGPRIRLTRLEISLALVLLALFSFNNLAPPHPGELRGDGFARLYQAFFLVVVSFSARFVQATDTPEFSSSRLHRAAPLICVATVFGNASIVYGPLVYSRFSGEMYWRFYRYDTGSAPTPPEHMIANLHHYGRRPLGFCDRGPFGPPPLMGP
jgi:hypothetical protein